MIPIRSGSLIYTISQTLIDVQIAIHCFDSIRIFFCLKKATIPNGLFLFLNILIGIIGWGGTAIP